MRVTHATGRNAVRTANEAAERSTWRTPEPNLVRPLTRFAHHPADASFAAQWHLHAPQPRLSWRRRRHFLAPRPGTSRAAGAKWWWRLADDGFDLTLRTFKAKARWPGSSTPFARQRKQRCHRLELGHRARPGDD